MGEVCCWIVGLREVDGRRGRDSRVAEGVRG